MREAKIVVDMIQGELLPHAVLTLTQRADPSSDRRHMLANRKVNALNKRRIDLPTAGHQHLLDRLQRAEHDPVMHANQPPPAYGLHHLRIEQVGPWHPARLRCRALRPPTGGLHPVSKVRQHRGQVVYPTAADNSIAPQTRYNAP